MRKPLLAACATVLACGFMPAHAQPLQMTDAPAAQASGSAPERGMSKAQVEATFGAPSEKVGAVGHPPIGRWVYPGFTVYFEYNHVVHAVLTPAGR